MQTNERDTPGVLGSNEGLGPLPEQAGWAVVMHGEAVLFANNAEKARGMSAGATSPVFTSEQMRVYAARAVVAERERCAAIARRWGETHADGVTVNARNAADKISRDIEGPNVRVEPPAEGRSARTRG